MLKGLETAVYFVDDLAAAAAWYRKVLGITPNHESEFYVGFTVGGDELGLHPSGDGKGPSTAGQAAYWTVTDIRAAIAHFVEHGAREQKPVQDVGGGILIGSLVDPFGNLLGLIQNPHSPNAKR
jgi:predicted enzyme related to lactoylglutathione lyase